MPVNQNTTGRSYPLPHPTNLLAEDVLRLRAALQAIDDDISARPTNATVQSLVSAATAALVDGSPAMLDTLNELAAALADDPNFATTVTNLLALKANIADVYTKSQVYSKAESDARYVQGAVQTEMVFTATANQSLFTLSTAVINKASALVTVDGVVQPTAEYSLNQAGTELTLSEGVPAGTLVRVLALGVASAGAPADDTVTTPKLRDGAVTTGKIADAAITTGKVADGAITTGKLADNAVTTGKIANGAITSAKLGVTLPNPLTLQTEKNATGTFVDFTDIPTWVKRITISFHRVSTAANNNVFVRLGVAGGSLQTTGYTSNSIRLTTGTPAFSTATNGFLVANALASDLITGQLALTLLTAQSAGHQWVASGCLLAAVGSAMVIDTGHITLSPSGSNLSIATIRIAPESSSFDGDGLINILYEG